MTAPTVKLLRPHVEGCTGQWIVDRQRPIEQCDKAGRRSHVGGTPHLSMRCDQPRGCTARATVSEHGVLALLTFGKKAPAAPTRKDPT